MYKHPFHIVDIRPWPIRGAVGGLFIFTGLCGWIHKFDSIILFTFGAFVLSMTICQWWRDVRREATFQGKHTNKVEGGMRMGMILFIVSEVFFFFTFFWAFFHSSLRPRVDIYQWPPTGLSSINPYEVPLLNTTVLLSRGATITWTHISVLKSDWLEANIGFTSTILLGIFFTILQLREYVNRSFSLADSVYGRTFFVATGFHGLHVIIGTLFIVISWFRHIWSHYSRGHHFGFEARAWYWHFVDVVWLILFLCLYWWGF